jgi:hypothetical protein
MVMSGAGGRARGLRSGLLMMAMLMASGGALWAALPRIAAFAIEERAASLLAATVELTGVEVDALRGRLAVRRAALFDGETGDELARSGLIVADLDWGALFGGAIRLEYAAIDGLVIRIAFDDEQRLNWDSALAGPPDTAEVGEPFDFSIERAELTGGAIELVDEAQDGLPDVHLALAYVALDEAEMSRPTSDGLLRWGLANAQAEGWKLEIGRGENALLEIAFDVGVGRSASNGAIPLSLHARRADGLALTVDGDMRVDPFSLEIDAVWEQLQSRAVMPFFALAGVRVVRGLSSGEIHARFSLAHSPDRGLIATGAIEHRDLVLEAHPPFVWEPVGPGATPFRLEVPHVVAELAELRVPLPSEPLTPPPPIALRWRRIDIDGPYVDLVMPVDLADLGVASTSPAPAQALERVGIEVEVEALSVARGRLRVQDPVVSADHTISDIQANATRLRWPSPTFENGSVVLGSLGEPPLRIEGTWQEGRADLAVHGSRIALAPWSPLLHYYSGYSVQRGAVSVTSDIEVRGTKYDAPVSFVFSRPKAKSEGGAFQKMFGVSLGIAIQLLMDPAGNIQLEVPISGDIEEEVAIGIEEVIVSALGESISNALANIIVAPADAVGMFLRRFGEGFRMGLAELHFAAGEADLPPQSRAALMASAGFVATSSDTNQLEFVPELVMDDLYALGILHKDANVLARIADSAGEFFRGGPKLDDEMRARIEDLLERRVDGAVVALRASGTLPGARIVGVPWDGETWEGIPRVLMRVRIVRGQKAAKPGAK